MRKTPYNPHPNRYRCRSGLMGWTCRLQAVYECFGEFLAYCDTYGIHLRLGFQTPEAAWAANPQVCGSTDPRDYGRVGTGIRGGPGTR